MASPKKYRVSLARIRVRELWLNVQGVKPANRTHDDWLSAANRELEPEANVVVNVGGIVKMPAFEKPQETVELLLSFEAACGCKLALVETAKTAQFRSRVELMDIAKGFGPEFEKMVRKAAKLPESDDLDEDAELEGIPAEAPAPLALVQDEAAPAEGGAK